MIKCKKCGTNFIGRKDTQKFCSKSCASKYTVANRKDNWRPDNKGVNNPMYGKKMTNPKSLANLTPGNKGYKHSQEWKDNISKMMKGKIWSKEAIDKRRKTNIKNGYWMRPDDPHYEEFKKYKRKVTYWTYKKNDLSKLENYDKRGRKGYHLDHKFSIYEGFMNDIPPKVIGNINNLEYIPYKQNLIKGTNCSMTKEKLYGLQ